MKNTSIAEKVRAKVKRMRKAQPFTLERFCSLGPSNQHAVRLAIARMVKQGDLERVYRGVYMRPKQSPYVGLIRANAIQVARVLAKKYGHILQVHGAEAIRRLGLSTQMQVTPVYYTSGSSSVIRVGKSSVRLQHKPATWFLHANSKLGLIVSALLYLGPAAHTVENISTIGRHLNETERQLLKSSPLPKWIYAFVDALDPL
ncbi:DUF6088 family protein [Pseudomonas sp. NPDC077649]|uniref:DUF6088 family protein n=1 Tax=Pseudomonas sp. NPDC077649 TaxID=3364423 RepID=UPI0037C9EDC2